MPSSGVSELRTKPDGDIGLNQARPSRLWLWVVAAFLVQFGAWATWLAIASRHQVREVPLVRSR